MLILKEFNKTNKSDSWLIHVNLGEVGLIINAPSKEEAIRLAKERAHKMVTEGTCSFTIPKIMKIDGKPYQAPLTVIQVKSHIP
jgi:hypothetical protein